jgi:hypothetical protein
MSSRIGVEASVTPLHPPGNSEADATECGDWCDRTSNESGAA